MRCQWQDAIVKEFEVPVEGEKGMRELSSRLLREMETGLAQEDHTGTVKMLITYVHDLPDGKEEGDFLALDLGERCVCVCVHACPHAVYLFPTSAEATSSSPCTME